MPPDRKAPSGASLRRCTATESRIAARIASALPWLGAGAGRRSARQYRYTSTAPPGRAMMACPGGSTRIGGVSASGGGTYWNAR